MSFTYTTNIFKGDLLKVKEIFLMFMIVFPGTVLATWDGTESGKINRIEVTSGNNYGFRVLLEGTPALCGNEHNWAYLNETNSNYNTYVSVLLAAKLSNKAVTLFTRRKDGVSTGFCNIGYVYLH